MPRLSASARYALRDVRAAYVEAAFKSGRFVSQQRGSRIRCTFCNRTGYRDGYWLDNCLKGHPYTCQCGAVFATKQALATHRRHWEQ